MKISQLAILQILKNKEITIEQKFHCSLFLYLASIINPRKFIHNHTKEFVDFLSLLFTQNLEHSENRRAKKLFKNYCNETKNDKSIECYELLLEFIDYVEGHDDNN